jgi:DNA-binding NtrC family response regulator
MPEALGPLAGFRVLLVEDEYMIAVEMAAWLRQAGAEVAGPVPDVAQALTLIDRAPGALHAAVLDANLGEGETADPIVSRLEALGVPYVFATGDVQLIASEDRRRPRLEKPIAQRDLLRTLDRMLKP